MRGLLSDPPTWDYKNHGTDWNFTNCNNTEGAQSPRNIEHTTSPDGTKKVTDWNQFNFGFIPNFRPSNIDFNGIQDFVYQLNLTDTTASKGYQGFWGSEPYSDPDRNSIVKWSIDHVRFHYRSEHSIGNKTFDLEMQIWHKVSFQSLYLLLIGPWRTSLHM
jgi:carbonic anhydrase